MLQETLPVTIDLQAKWFENKITKSKPGLFRQFDLLMNETCEYVIQSLTYRTILNVRTLFAKNKKNEI